MNFRLTVALVIVLALVASIYFILPARQDAGKATSTTTSLLNPPPKDIASITLLQDGVARFKFAKQGAQWKMTVPISTDVDASQLDSVARSLQNLMYRQKFEPEDKGNRSPEGTGVAKPRNIVKFTDSDGHEHTLICGYRGSDNASRFVTLDAAKTIYLLDSDPLSQLDRKSADEFRNKTIKEIDESKITRIDISGKEGTVSLSKSGNNWLIAQPAARANAAAVGDVLSQFRQIQATGFSTLKKEDVGLNPPVLAVTVWVQNESPTSAPASASHPATASQPAATPVTLQMGYVTELFDQEHSPVYASLADSTDVFTLSRDAYDKLNRQLKDLRDPAVTPAPVTEATDVTIHRQDAPAIALNKKDNVWTMASQPAPLAADAPAIEGFLAALRDERAIHYVDNAGDLKSIGLDPPRTKIEMTIPGQSQHEVILLGKPETADAVTPMMRQGEPTVYLVQTSEANKLNASPLTFRDRAIERLAADQIRSIAIAGPEAPEGGLTVEREGLHWVVKTGKADKGVAADDTKITSLLADFTPLTAQGYLAENAVQAGTPDLTVTVSILEPTVTTAPATSPAATTRAATTATATSTAPATTSRPAVQDALESRGMIGPDRGTTITRTLHLYKVIAPPATRPTTTSAPATAAATMPAFTWKAIWDAQSPAWTFEPTAMLIEHLTKVSYAAPPATQAGTQPATQGATTHP